MRDDAEFAISQTTSMSNGIELKLHYLPEWREFRGLTQEALAESAGTTKSVISLLENSQRQLSPKWLRRLAPVLNTSPGAILDYDPNAIPTAVLEVWANIPEDQQAQAMTVLQTFGRKKAG